MPPTGFDALHALVLADPGAQARLREATDWDAFTAEAGRLAAAHGIALMPAELEEARTAARRAWLERGI